MHQFLSGFVLELLSEFCDQIGGLSGPKLSELNKIGAKNWRSYKLGQTLVQEADQGRETWANVCPKSLQEPPKLDPKGTQEHSNLDKKAPKNPKFN